MNVKDMHPYANLHLHSTHSDGVYSPTELVTISKNEGYKALAITDHDTVSAYPELKFHIRKNRKAGNSEKVSKLLISIPNF